MLSIPILIQMGLVSVAVKYAVDKYADDNEPEGQKKPVSGDGYKLLEGKHKLLKEECSTNRQSISNIVRDSDQRNNALVDSIAAIDRKADNIYATAQDKIVVVDDKTKILSEVMKTYAKNGLDRIRQDYGASSGITKDIRKEFTIMEELLKNVERRNSS